MIFGVAFHPLNPMVNARHRGNALKEEADLESLFDLEAATAAAPEPEQLD